RTSGSCGLEVHAAHATGRVGGGSRSLLRLLGDDGLGGQEQTSDGGRVLQSGAGDLGRVDDAVLEPGDVLTGDGVQSDTGSHVLDLVDHDAAFEAGVDRDLLQRLGDGTTHDVGADRLVVLQLQLLQAGDPGLQQRNTTTGQDTFLDRGLGVADGVLDAVLALLELHLGGGAGLDDGHAAGQTGK